MKCCACEWRRTSVPSSAMRLREARAGLAAHERAVPRAAAAAAVERRNARRERDEEAEFNEGMVGVPRFCPKPAAKASGRRWFRPPRRGGSQGADDSTPLDSSVIRSPRLTLAPPPWPPRAAPKEERTRLERPRWPEPKQRPAPAHPQSPSPGNPTRNIPPPGSKTPAGAKRRACARECSPESVENGPSPAPRPTPASQSGR